MDAAVCAKGNMLHDTNDERAKVVAEFVKTLIAIETNDVPLPIFFDGMYAEPGVNVYK